MLRLNGTSIRVVPDGWTPNKSTQYFQSTACAQAWRAEDRKDIRIKWNCTFPDGMAEKGYWVVTTGHGTKYLFGSTDDSRQTIYPAPWLEAGDASPNTIRWRLKQSITTLGVAINYTYTTDTFTPSVKIDAIGKYEYQTYIDSIVYPGSKIKFNWTFAAPPGPKNGKLDNIDLSREKTNPVI